MIFGLGHANFTGKSHASILFVVEQRLQRHDTAQAENQVRTESRPCCSDKVHKSDENNVEPDIGPRGNHRDDQYITGLSRADDDRQHEIAERIKKQSATKDVRRGRRLDELGAEEYGD